MTKKEVIKHCFKEGYDACYSGKEKRWYLQVRIGATIKDSSTSIRSFFNYHKLNLGYVDNIPLSALR